MKTDSVGETADVEYSSLTHSLTQIPRQNKRNWQMTRIGSGFGLGLGSGLDQDSDQVLDEALFLSFDQELDQDLNEALDEDLDLADKNKT